MLLVLLLLFQSVWVFAGSETSIVHQSTLQTARANILLNDAETLAYRPTADHVFALNEMQATLLIFEQTQNGLLRGDATLGLPAGNRSDIASVLSTETVVFQEIDELCRTILQSKSVTPDQITVLVNRVRTFTTTSDTVTLAWKVRIDNAFFFIFFIEAILTCIIMIIVLFKHTFITRRIIRLIMKGTLYE